MEHLFIRIRKDYDSPWWDAVALGIEDAAKQFEQRGIFITYDYLAPEKMSALDQIERIQKAASITTIMKTFTP